MTPFEKHISLLTSRLLYRGLNIRNGRIIPSTESLVSQNAVRLNATFLYADLSQSSILATEFQQRTAAKIIRIFLYCMGVLVRKNKGEITSFDGDRIMSVFINKPSTLSLDRSSRAVVCSLQMNYTISNIIKPKVEKYFSSIRESGFDILHSVGIDTSEVLVTRAGPPGRNDRIWIGRAPNFAAKLSDIRDPIHSTWITHEVFSSIIPELKFPIAMWKKYNISFAASSHSIYGSDYYLHI